MLHNASERGGLTSCCLIAQDGTRHGKVAGQKDGPFVKGSDLGISLNKPDNEVQTGKAVCETSDRLVELRRIR